MQRVWYHGTNESSAHNICEHGIDFTKSKKELDFGRGFYMTDDKNVAKKRAQTQTKKYNRIYRKKDKPAVVVITINIDMVNTYNIKRFDYCNEEWLYFILANRLSYEYVQQNCMENNLDSKYDLVIGSIADSNVSEIASHIQNKDVAIEMVSVYDVLTEDGRTLGTQMSFHTEKALTSIVSMKCEIITGGV